jgi:hypothetical protein
MCKQKQTKMLAVVAVDAALPVNAWDGMDFHPWNFPGYIPNGSSPKHNRKDWYKDAVSRTPTGILINDHIPIDPADPGKHGFS